MTAHDDSYDFPEFQSSESQDEGDQTSETPVSSEEQAYMPLEYRDEDDDEDVSSQIEDSVEQIREFDDLTLAEVTSQFFKAPSSTMSALRTVVFARPNQPRSASESVMIAVPSAPVESNVTSTRERVKAFFDSTRQDKRKIQLALYLAAFVVVWWGSGILVNAPRRTETEQLSAGAPYLLIGFLIWLGAEVYGNYAALKRWWDNHDFLRRMRVFARVLPLLIILNALAVFVRSFDVPADVVFPIISAGLQFLALGISLWVIVDVAAWILRRAYENAPTAFPEWWQEKMPIIQHEPPEEPQTKGGYELPWWMNIHPLRVFLAMIGLAFCIVTWFGSTGNSISNRVLFIFPVFYIWIASIVIWAYILSPLNWNPLKWAQEWIGRLRAFKAAKYTAIFASIAVILLVGGYFRFAQLDTLPPEMTDDHVEKILDSQRVLDGQHMIFFANNGGREPIQMYLMAAFVKFTGRDMDHDTLKLLKAIESLVTLPFMFWLGVEMIGKDNRRLGIVVGLLLAALVSVSYWHVAVSRQALRITLMPLVTALLMIYLARGMRYNQRADFIKAGLILGFGLYVYQAVRMLPIVVVVGVIIAVWMTAKTWADRWKYGVNLAVLVLISFVVFIPMFRYSAEHPEEFWRRTAGRLLGDDIIYEEADDGTISERNATFGERLQAFNDNVPIIMSNIRNVLLMYNWKGDVAWISGVPNHPAMDTVTGSLLILGLAAWGVRAFRTRDSVDMLIPIMVFIMLMPSALSIAYPIENPSATRTMGSLPPAYLLAAFPLALIVTQITSIWQNRRGWVAATGLVVILFGGAYAANSYLYFNEYPEHYILASYPYTDAGEKMRGFAISDGAYGNIFMIAYPHWWSHRAIGIESGSVGWPNGIISLDDVPRFMSESFSRTDQYRFDPNKDILFLFSPDDVETRDQLQEWFPEGRLREVTTYQHDDSYMMYRVPWLGTDAFVNFLVGQGVLEG